MMALSLAILSPPLFQPLSQTVQSLPPQVVFSEGFVRAMLYHPFQEARYATYSPSHTVISFSKPKLLPYVYVLLIPD